MPDVFGEQLTVEELGRLAKMTPSTVHRRLQSGHSVAHILATPVRKSTDLVGERFGRLLIIAECDKRSGAGKRRYCCKCDCGTTKDVIGTDLKSGRTVSCGCLRNERTRAARISEAEDITGMSFADGWVRVIEQSDFVAVRRGNRERRVRHWRCTCKCGNRFEARAAALRQGQITSCGCRKRESARSRMKAKAARHDYFGEQLTLAEIASRSGTDAPTIGYRMRRLGMTAEQAATCAPLRKHSQKPKGRRPTETAS